MQVSELAKRSFSKSHPNTFTMDLYVHIKKSLNYNTRKILATISNKHMKIINILYTLTICPAQHSPTNTVDSPRGEDSHSQTESLVPNIIYESSTVLYL